MLRIALAQINTTVGDLDGNSRKILEGVASAREKGCDLIAFPEMALTGYPPEDLLLKGHFISKNLAVLKAIAREVRGITAVVGFVDRDPRGLYNAAAVISSGRLQAVYHKHLLPNYSVFDEKRYFAPGDKALVLCQGDVTFGVNICEDIWRENGPARVQARAGARLIVNISSSPYEAGKRRERLALLSRRARETGAVMAYVNLVGGQDELVFDGASLIVSPRGKVLASGAQFREDLVIADLDLPRGRGPAAVFLPATERRKRSHAFPANCPRPLGADAEVYEALVLGTGDYIRKNGFRKVLIGLSGGIDSALVAAIARDAVGPENVVGISMPTRFNSAGTKTDARRLARNLGIVFHEIPIEKILGAFQKTLRPYSPGLSGGLAGENIQSRIRGNILMAFSNAFGWLVLTTGNESEMATGYCTLYGDMSGGYAVIKDILKTRVYDLARYVNRRDKRNVIPLSVIRRAPSAELRFGQKDQDSLPPYSALDALLVEYVERHSPLKKMLRKGSPLVVKKVVELVDKSEYKRRQAPPGVKISVRSFGKDWRLPLTNKYKTSGSA